MPAVAGVQVSPPIRWGNADGKAIIAEVWRFPASTAGFTLALVSTNIAQLIAFVGPFSHTAVTSSEAGISVAVITSLTIAASNFNEGLLIGYARDVV